MRTNSEGLSRQDLPSKLLLPIDNPIGVAYGFLRTAPIIPPTIPIPIKNNPLF